MVFYLFRNFNTKYFIRIEMKLYWGLNVFFKVSIVLAQSVWEAGRMDLQFYNILLSF